MTKLMLSQTSICIDRRSSLSVRWSTLRAAALVLLMCATASATLSAQTVTTLLTFDGTDGSSQIPALVEGRDGNLYGTTEGGGPSNAGTVFKITPQGTLTTLYNFCSLSNCVDGRVPSAALVLGTDGNFYGTTFLGGAGVIDGGTVFKMTPQGTLTTLHSFCLKSSSCEDGELPEARLVEGGDGNFYGTTNQGGDMNIGTVFRITRSGHLTTIHSFAGTEGYFPVGPGMVLGADGYLYGTTSQGGGASHGTFFRITLAGDLTTLYSFCSSGCRDEPGLIPIVQAPNGNFYGTIYGGCVGNDGCGSVFQLTPAGEYTTLYTFCQLAFCADGDNPVSLVQGSDGNLYGTTQYGGMSNGNFGSGTIFRISSHGVFTSLYAFCTQTGCPDGGYPGNLVQNTSGTFFGATESGTGTIFSFNQNLPRFVELSPRSGAVGASVVVLGNGLIGSTSVSFNGTTADFTVISNTEIRATVPAGATTGKIRVATARGTISSDVVFSVVP